MKFHFCGCIIPVYMYIDFKMISLRPFRCAVSGLRSLAILVTAVANSLE